MKTTKLVARVRKLLSRPPQDTKLKKLRKTVKALKKKQEELEDKLKRTRGKDARQRLRQKIDVLRAQRQKGAEVYRRLKAERDAAEEAPPPADTAEQPPEPSTADSPADNAG
ncbi:MAG: hypothetical protein H6955_05770 [Chromatiaceae bacterium]|nr:hypothetical protein [Gammaproteobacteria bacterium]MCP5313042.1 hypothetical protein [Chromatiaceae bacterium]